MFRFQDISIKRKLMLIVMIASTVALLLVSCGFVVHELVTYRQGMVRELSTLAQIIGDRSTAALNFENPDDAGETLRALSHNTHIVAAALYDKKGQLFAEYRPSSSVEEPPRWPEQPGTRFERDHLIVFHKINDSSGFCGTLYLKSDMQAFYERLRQYALMVLVFLAVSLAVTFFLSSLLQRIISRPIFHLADTARTVSMEKNYSVRATKTGNDELGQLIDGFNEMLGQIQHRDVALQESNDMLEKRVQERTQDLQAEVSERRRAEAALQQQFMRISLLNQITQVISERQDLESILHVVLRQLEDHFSLDLGSVALFDAQSEKLNVSALRVKNPLLAAKLDLREGTVIPMAEAGLSQCQEGLTVYLPDTVKSPTMLTERLAGVGLRSVVAVPLMVEGKLFGVLLSARLKPEDFSSGECEFLRMLSEHVALAAHQARLYSELESAYNELRQTQQAVMQQERLKALGQMASGIAHDVNNALSPVVGFADLLLHREQGLTEGGKRYLKHIRTAGEDIAHIVARLREFYRRREEKEDLQTLNLNSIVDQVMDMTRPRWRDIPQSNGITIEMQPELTSEVIELVGIESEVREALTNLVINAVDAMPNGGRITLRTSVLRQNLGNNGSRIPTHVAVEVSDTGTGMSEETRRRCLEPFFSTKGKRGTGLGLAMVYGVMERHDGTIEVLSELGKGTTFRLVFPVRKPVHTASDTDDGSLRPKPMQILCIDDEPLLCELLKEILEHDGHQVSITDGGQAGVDAFRAAKQQGQPFDVVITDLGMPYLDGRQVAKLLKNESPTTPVIMLTGWGAFMKEEGAAPTQVDGVLSKPPRSRELREMLLRLGKVGEPTAN